MATFERPEGIPEDIKILDDRAKQDLIAREFSRNEKAVEDYLRADALDDVGIAAHYHFIESPRQTTEFLVQNYNAAELGQIIDSLNSQIEDLGIPKEANAAQYQGAVARLQELADYKALCEKAMDYAEIQANMKVSSPRAGNMLMSHGGATSKDVMRTAQLAAQVVDGGDYSLNQAADIAKGIQTYAGKMNEGPLKQELEQGANRAADIKSRISHEAPKLDTPKPSK